MKLGLQPIELPLGVQTITISRGGPTLCLGGSNEPLTSKKKKKKELYIFNIFLLV